MAEIARQSPYPTLGPGGTDRVAAGLRALVGAAPMVGAALAEIVTEIIPNQRLDRLEQYVRLLAQEMERRAGRWSNLGDPRPMISDRMQKPQNIDLIEDGAHLAARALSEQRMGYIVHCVVNGIEAEDRAKIHHKRILSIIGEMDDEEILILDAFGSNDTQKFRRVRPEFAPMGAPPELVEANTLYNAAVDKLERLSLIAFRQQFKEINADGAAIGRRIEKIKVPAIDAFGKPEGHRGITHLGELVLKSIGLEVPKRSDLRSPRDHRTKRHA